MSIKHSKAYNKVPTSVNSTGLASTFYRSGKPSSFKIQPIQYGLIKDDVIKKLVTEKNEGNKAESKGVEHVEKNPTSNNQEKNIIDRLYEYCLNVFSKFFYINKTPKDYSLVRADEEIEDLYKKELALPSDEELLLPVSHLSKNRKNESHPKKKLSQLNSHSKKELEDLIYRKKSEYLKAKFSSSENEATLNEYQKSLEKLTIKLNKVKIEESGIDPHAPVYSNVNTYSGANTKHSNPQKYKEAEGTMQVHELGGGNLRGS